MRYKYKLYHSFKEFPLVLNPIICFSKDACVEGIASTAGVPMSYVQITRFVRRLREAVQNGSDRVLFYIC